MKTILKGVLFLDVRCYDGKGNIYILLHERGKNDR